MAEPALEIEPIETATMLPVYVSAQQVAEMIGCDVTTVYRLASSDVSMPVLRLGGIVRFHRERLLEWLSSHEQGASRREQGASRAQRRARDAQPRAAAASRG